MKKQIILILLIGYIACGTLPLPLKISGSTSNIRKNNAVVSALETGMRVTLKGNNGMYLARCRDCGKAS